MGLRDTVGIDPDSKGFICVTVRLSGAPVTTRGYMVTESDLSPLALGEGLRGYHRGHRGSEWVQQAPGKSPAGSRSHLLFLQTGGYRHLPQGGVGPEQRQPQIAPPWSPFCLHWLFCLFPARLSVSRWGQFTRSSGARLEYQTQLSVCSPYTRTTIVAFPNQKTRIR